MIKLLINLSFQNLVLVSSEIIFRGFLFCPRSSYPLCILLRKALIFEEGIQKQESWSSLRLGRVINLLKQLSKKS